MECRLGQVLVEQGVLTGEQVESILARQKETGEPFGLLCEQIFSIAPETIENAWALQYARLTRTIDPAAETFDVQALSMVTRRQAWQFRVLPVRFDGQELMIATTQRHLRRALRFAVNVIGVPVFFVMADSGRLGSALCRHYALPGFTPDCVDGDGLDHLFRRQAA
jgi:hypothetical protein